MSSMSRVYSNILVAVIVLHRTKNAQAEYPIMLFMSMNMLMTAKKQKGRRL